MTSDRLLCVVCPFGQMADALPQLGTFGRAKRKVDELQGVLAEAKRAGH